MADLPRNAGRSPSGVALDDSSSESSVPAWLAARRARVPTSRDEAPPEPTSQTEPEIEFASLPDNDTGTNEFEPNGSMPQSLPAPKILDRDVPVQPKPVVPLPPPPLRRGAFNPLRAQAAPVITELPISPEDESLKGQMLRWMKSATMTGLAVSLVVHTVLLSVLAVVVFKNASINRAMEIFGVIGDPSENELSQIELDSSLPVDPGQDAASLEFSDFSQIATSDRMSFNPSESLRGVPGTGQGRGEGEGDGIGVAAPNIPKYAVTKGSFSAWTDPKDPEPGRSYEIVIQFRLPGNVKSYKGSDLTGMVIGTDGYKQVIKFSRTESFPVQDGNIQVRIRVPGADRLVRDTIRIESKLLHEKQMIEIEF